MALRKKISVKRVGFVVKRRQPEAGSLADQTARHLLTQGCSVFFPDEASEIASALGDSKSVHVCSKEELHQKSDLIVVFGGDGTYLSVARLMKERSVPVIGVNVGTLGFLTPVRREEAIPVIDEILKTGEVNVSERTLLDVTLMRGGEQVFQGPVVNDVVVSKGAIARIIGMELEINGQIVNRVRADGLIVSTPTGSTAYALAAGGPILHPRVPALVVAPICPHGLAQRPLVVADEFDIKIRLEHRPGHVLLTLDGQDAFDMKEDDLVCIRRFGKHRLQQVVSAKRKYFDLLKEKLEFGGRKL